MTDIEIIEQAVACSTMKPGELWTDRTNGLLHGFIVGALVTRDSILIDVAKKRMTSLLLKHKKDIIKFMRKNTD